MHVSSYHFRVKANNVLFYFIVFYSVDCIVLGVTYTTHKNPNSKEKESSGRSLQVTGQRGK